MRTLQDYRDIYRTISDKLNLKGDSVELLVQMLAQASYIEEVENLSYTQEASIEKAVLMNSKISHCMDNMYSVYRGHCPRVIIKFRANKYFSFKMFDELIVSNNFKVYYLGYYDYKDYNVLAGKTVKDAAGSSYVATEEGFHYGPITILPDTGEDVVLIGLLAKSRMEESWQLSENEFYVESTGELLSNDVVVTIDGVTTEVTRDFSEHVLNSKVYDLTIPAFGSRLYIPSPETSSNITAVYYNSSSVKDGDYNKSELRKMNIRGITFTTFNDDGIWLEWMKSRKYDPDTDEIATGIIILDSTGADTASTIHYRAAKERYVTSIIRSNSDIGYVLEETFPEKVRTSGTTYKFNSNGDMSLLTIYYVPEDESNLLTYAEISDFVENKRAYYITDSIGVEKGIKKELIFSIDVDLYQNASVDEDIEKILSNYSYKFNMDFSENSDYLEEIKTLIGKISNVSKVTDLSIVGYDDSLDLSITYFDIQATINSKVSTKI